jgi:hypothetical protein
LEQLRYLVKNPKKRATEARQFCGNLTFESLTSGRHIGKTAADIIKKILGFVAQGVLGKVTKAHDCIFNGSKVITILVVWG